MNAAGYQDSQRVSGERGGSKSSSSQIWSHDARFVTVPGLRLVRAPR